MMGKPDFVVFPGSQMHHHCMTVARLPARKFYWDAELHISTQMAVQRWYEMDGYTVIAHVYNWETVRSATDPSLYRWFSGRFARPFALWCTQRGPFSAKESTMSDALTKLKQAVLEGDDATAAATAQQALAEGLKGLDIVNSAIVPGIQAAGQLWKENQYFLPDVVMSAEAFSAAMAVVQPTLTAEGATHTGRVLIGTVAGDMHTLGKSIVIAMLQGAGFEVTDLGVDVPVKTFLDKTAELKPDILGAGCYMSTTMLSIKDIIAGLQERGLRNQVKVMVGGVPTSQEFADEVGADAWGKDALDATAKARQLMRR